MSIATVTLDVEAIRAQFPILARQVAGVPVAYLDNAATAQVPQTVLDVMTRHYVEGHANVHRGVHTLSHEATVAYDAARATAARFLNAPSADDLVFAHGTTSALNLVARAWGDANIRAGDEILLTTLEHHSNIVPWVRLAERAGAVIKVVPLTVDGSLDLDAGAELVGPRTKVLAFAHASNVLGTVAPVRRMADLAHAAGAIVVIDGAQAAPHLVVDVQALDCDFYVASGHKLYGPNGIGLLYGRAALLAAMPPYEGGGGMIEQVGFDRITYAPPPGRFEAGTPPIAEALGLGAALEWLMALDRAALEAHEQDLLAYATERLKQISDLTVHGNAPGKVSVLSFTLAGIHPHDIGTVLDRHGVAIRAGHHCAQPLMRHLRVPATARASFAAYNTRAEVDLLADGIVAAKRMFA
ncbi:MAG: SufS family cysteine desulfurase [Gemmatimonadota bacterium]